jgi:hypothetical protein
VGGVPDGVANAVDVAFNGHASMYGLTLQRGAGGLVSEEDVPLHGLPCQRRFAETWKKKEKQIDIDAIRGGHQAESEVCLFIKYPLLIACIAIACVIRVLESEVA